MKICTLPGCGQPIGAVPYRIYGKTEEYCSRACVDQVLAGLRKTGQRHPRPVDKFGNAGVTRQSCRSCGKPLGLQPDGSSVLALQGQDGRYCSAKCLEIEKEKVTMISDNDSPIAPAAPAAKKAAKAAKGAAAKKAAPAKKAPAKKAAKAAKAPAKKAAKAPEKRADKYTADAPFREGSTKAAVFAALKDGKVHKREELWGIIDKDGKTHQLLGWVLDRAEEYGWKIVQKGPEVQIARK